MFENSPVAVDDISTASPMSFSSLSPQYYITATVLRCLVALVAILLSLVGHYFTIDLLPVWGSYAMWLLTVLLCINVIYGYFADQQKGYCLRAHDISFTSGLVFKCVVTQPLCKLQHSEIRRSLLARWLGLASIYVFSAGGVSHTFIIPGLSLQNAEKIRQLFIDYGA